MQNTHINQRKVTVEINFLIDFILEAEDFNFHMFP